MVKIVSDANDISVNSDNSIYDSVNESIYFSCDSFCSNLSSEVISGNFGNFSLLFWNVAGLLKKFSDYGFLDYLKSFDIFALAETWLLENDFDKCSNLFSDYNLFFIGAKKLFAKGRASQGMVIAFKKSLKYLSFINIAEFKCIKINLINDRSIIFLPLYLPENSWDKKFAMIEDFLSLAQSDCILMGDLNARIGLLDTMQGQAVGDGRKSEDIVVNSKGQKLIELCNNYNLMILNGVHYGDKIGNFTFRSQGNSVIDYAIISPHINITNFKIDNAINSDHMPIVINMQLGLAQVVINENIEPLTPKLLWNTNNQKLDKFKNFTQNTIITESCDMTKYCQNIVDLFRASNIFSEKPAKIIYRKPWFDSECFKSYKVISTTFKLLKKKFSTQLDN
ncbi:MAG TPA: endonuclease/exonuclease/phosphatase family protein, partial [Aquella sp.]|nr:endonuclease/exonuclease/phosphatase family protein [Aquella sp.]